MVLICQRKSCIIGEFFSYCRPDAGILDRSVGCAIMTSAIAVLIVSQAMEIGHDSSFVLPSAAHGGPSFVPDHRQKASRARSRLRTASYHEASLSADSLGAAGRRAVHPDGACSCAARPRNRLRGLDRNRHRASLYPLRHDRHALFRAARPPRRRIGSADQPQARHHRDDGVAGRPEEKNGCVHPAARLRMDPSVSHVRPDLVAVQLRQHQHGRNPVPPEHFPQGHLPGYPARLPSGRHPARCRRHRLLRAADSRARKAELPD